MSATGLHGSATIVNSDLFKDVQHLKEQVPTSYLNYDKRTSSGYFMK